MCVCAPYLSAVLIYIQQTQIKHLKTESNKLWFKDKGTSKSLSACGLSPPLSLSISPFCPRVQYGNVKHPKSNGRKFNPNTILESFESRTSRPCGTNSVDHRRSYILYIYIYIYTLSVNLDIDWTNHHELFC